MSIVMRHTVCAVVAAAMGGCVQVNAQTVDQGLRQAIVAREEAFAARDLTRWSQYTTENYRLTSETGTVRTKADQLASMRVNPASVAKRGARTEEAVQRYGDTVILWLLVDSQNGPRREMHVWVKDGGTWKVAAVQVTMAPKQ